MALNLLKFEEKVNLLLLAKTLPKVIATTLKKNPKVYLCLYRSGVLLASR